MKKKSVYVLYDKNELPVLVTSDPKELSEYLGNKSVNCTFAVIYKYLKGINKRILDREGNVYSLYKYKEQIN